MSSNPAFTHRKVFTTVPAPWWRLWNRQPARVWHWEVRNRNGLVVNRGPRHAIKNEPQGA